MDENQIGFMDLMYEINIRFSFLKAVLTIFQKLIIIISKDPLENGRCRI